jgi:Zn-dependent M28 family amino/carboxypeptidase
MPPARISKTCASATLLAGLIAAATSSAFAASDAKAPDLARHQPEIDKIVSEISPQRIEGYIRKLVSFGTRHTMSDATSETRGIGAARRWIKSELERCGAGTRMQVAFDGYVDEGGPKTRISKPTEVVDVVATLPGTQAESKDRMYVVSGHYDSRVTDVMNDTADAPGANDDASGTAAVIEMACVMARHNFDATLVFMTVAGEEQGLLGSKHYADEAKTNGWNIAGMFDNDIIGSSHADDGQKDDSQVRLFAQGVAPTREMSDANRTLVVTGGENDSITRQLARHIKEQGERYVKGFKVNVIYRTDRYLRGGDHSPFLANGYAAVRFTEPNENFDHQHQDLRTENGKVYGDLAQFDDFNYIARVTRVNAAALASLALAPAVPEKVGARTDKLENDTTLVWEPNKEPDLAGYRIVWRETTAPFWQGSKYVGNVTEASLKLSKDNYFFGVQAVDKDGNVSPATYPLPKR